MLLIIMHTPNTSGDTADSDDDDMVLLYQQDTEQSQVRDQAFGGY